MTLTLPIEPGKKYVRRDGKIDEAIREAFGVIEWAIAASRTTPKEGA